jgi:hypothetical protein
MDKMKFYKANSKGFFKYLMIGAVILPVVVFFFDTDTFLEKPFVLLPLTIPIVLTFWIYYDTGYRIENNELTYRSGFLRGKIDIAAIREVVKGKTMWSGLKPALSTKGLIIKFNRFDEIYIAPESNDEIITDLLSVNPKIKIIEK